MFDTYEIRLRMIIDHQSWTVNRIDDQSNWEGMRNAKAYDKRRQDNQIDNAMYVQAPAQEVLRSFRTQDKRPKPGQQTNLGKLRPIEAVRYQSIGHQTESQMLTSQ